MLKFSASKAGSSRSRATLKRAERNFLTSLDWARRREAKSWELRTSTSLARLWQSQGKRQRGVSVARPGLRLVHRGVRTQGFAGSEGSARRTGVVWAMFRPPGAVVGSCADYEPQRPDGPPHSRGLACLPQQASPCSPPCSSSLKQMPLPSAPPMSRRASCRPPSSCVGGFPGITDNAEARECAPDHRRLETAARGGLSDYPVTPS